MIDEFLNHRTLPKPTRYSRELARFKNRSTMRPCWDQWCGYIFLLSFFVEPERRSRFGFRRLFEFATLVFLPSWGICVCVVSGVHSRGLRCSFVCTNSWINRLTELRAAPKPNRKANPTPGSSVIDSW